MNKLTVIENYNNIESEGFNISDNEREQDMKTICEICRELDKINTKYMKFIKNKEYGQVNTSLDSYEHSLLLKAKREVRCKVLTMQNISKRIYENYRAIIEVD